MTPSHDGIAEDLSSWNQFMRPPHSTLQKTHGGNILLRRESVLFFSSTSSAVLSATIPSKFEAYLSMIDIMLSNMFDFLKCITHLYCPATCPITMVTSRVFNWLIDNHYAPWVNGPSLEYCFS